MRVGGLDWLFWNSGLLLVDCVVVNALVGWVGVVSGFSLGLGLVVYDSSG